MVYRHGEPDRESEQTKRISNRDLARIQRFSLCCHVTSKIHYSIDILYEHGKWTAVLTWKSDGPELNADYSQRHHEAVKSKSREKRQKC